jgi:hypothetical protein
MDNNLKVSFSVDGKKKPKLKKDALNYVDLLQEYLRDPKYKTELCKTYNEDEFCVYGNKCRFAHGKEELFQKENTHPKYKIKQCVYFFQKSYCTYGSRCHFKHNETRLNQIYRSYYSYLLNLIELNIEEKLTPPIEMTFFDESDNIPINISNRPISPNTNSITRESIIQEMIIEKLAKKCKARRLPVFEKITEKKSNFNFSKNETSLITKRLFPLFEIL